MKKTFIITTILLLAIIAKTQAQLIVYNNTCETAYVVLYAEDAGTPPTPCGGWVSYTITILPGKSFGTNTPAWLNDPTMSCTYSGGSVYSVGWASGPSALMPCYDPTLTPSLAPWGWDGAQVSNSGGTVTVGNSSCISTGSGSTFPGTDLCSGSPMMATWSVSGSGITLTISD